MNSFKRQNQESIYTFVQGLFFDDEGNLRRVISYSRDLTELYQLRQKVEEMDNQLKHIKKELRETYEHEGLIF